MAKKSRTPTKKLKDLDKTVFLFEKDKLYITRQGDKVRIYSIEENGDHPIHGAYKSNDGFWLSRSWTIDGWFFSDSIKSMCDIAGEWIDDIKK